MKGKAKEIKFVVENVVVKNGVKLS